MKQQRDLTKGSVAGGLISFILPMLAGSFFQYFYNIADAIIVGQYVGKTGLAAVSGTTGVIINLLIGLFVGISAGSSVIISQRCGAHDEAGVRSGVNTTAALTLIISAILTLAGIFGVPSILRMINTRPDVIDQAMDYLTIYFGGATAMVVYNFGSGVLRALGDSRRPTIVLVICSFLNVGLDYLFVAVMGLDVAGAAIATVLAQAVSAVYIIICLMRQKGAARLHPTKIRIDGRCLWQMIRIGVPAGLQAIAYSVSNLMIQRYINGFSTDTVAAYSAYEKVELLYLMMVEAFGMAVSIYAGQNFGSGQYDRMKKSVRVCSYMCFGFTAVISVLLMVFDGNILRLFLHEQPIITQSCAIMACLVPYYFTCVLISVLPGALRSAGDAVGPIIITCVGICLFRVVFIAAGMQLWNDIRLICYSYPVSWGITSLVFLWYYRKTGWLKRCIARQKREDAAAVTADE